MNARLVELVDTSDLKSDSSIKSIGSSPITSKIFVAKKLFCQNDGIGRHARFRF